MAIPITQTKFKNYMFLKNLKTNEIAQFANTQEGWIEASKEEINNFLLTQAKLQKINELNSFILAEKTKPYTTFTAPELVPSIVNGKTQFKQGEPVSFIWYVDAIPNSKLTPESILNKCNLDMTSCIKASILDVKSIDLASLRANLATSLNTKIIPYTTTITKNGVQSTGMVNVFPIAESLANHIQQREVNSNVLNGIYLEKINNCKTVPEVEAITFTAGV